MSHWILSKNQLHCFFTYDPVFRYFGLLWKHSYLKNMPLDNTLTATMKKDILVKLSVATCAGT